MIPRKLNKMICTWKNRQLVETSTCVDSYQCDSSACFFLSLASYLFPALKISPLAKGSPLPPFSCLPPQANTYLIAPCSAKCYPNHHHGDGQLPPATRLQQLALRSRSLPPFPIINYHLSQVTRTWGSTKGQRKCFL